jgi:hypothetical protein
LTVSLILARNPTFSDIGGDPLIGCKATCVWDQAKSSDGNKERAENGVHFKGD